MHELSTTLERHGYRCRIFTDRQETRRALSDPESRVHLRGIVAAGGDGTLLDISTEYPGVPIAVLPLGTENLVARHLGIPRSGAVVAQMILSGLTCQLDAARLGNQRFTVMASVGFDAEVIHRAHAQRTGHITRAKYIRPILAAILEHTYPELRVYVDDHLTPTVGRVVVVANLPVYALGLNMVPTASGADGVLDVRVFQHGSLLQLVRYLYLIQMGQHDQAPDVITLRGQRIRIESDTPAPVQADGDPAGWTPVEIQVEPHYGTFFVPPSFLPDHR